MFFSNLFFTIFILIIVDIRYKVKILNFYGTPFIYLKTELYAYYIDNNKYDF